MATLPAATLSIVERAGAPATGSELVVIMACVSQSADFVPRIFGSVAGIIAQYGYCPGADYAAIHMQKTRKPVMFVGMPISVAGVVGRQDSSGVTGSSAITVSTGASGSMEETDGILTVSSGGTIGTDQIVCSLSLDGGFSSKTVRLGTASSFTLPYVGLTLNFGAGTLAAGDVYKFKSTAPMWGSTAIASARAALAAQQKLARSWMVIGDVDSTHASYVVTELDNYASANDRYVFGRVNVTDLTPLASKSLVSVKMTGTPNLTFDGTAHTITRSTGSFIADGFVVGGMVKIAGSVSNNGVKGALTGVSATVLTFASGLTSEGPVGGVSVSGSGALTFAAGGHTITRSAGSWIADGFAVGDVPTVAGTVSNNTTMPAITSLTATVMTFGSGVTTEGPLFDSDVTVTKGQTIAAWMAAQSAAFATIDAEKRIDLAAGRARVQSPILGWNFRRPAAWAVSCREYQHDVQIPTYRKDDGPLSGFSIYDASGNIVEFDENNDGGGLAARFTVLRSYSNGPIGTFVALSLTRDTDGKPLSRTHNMAVANVASTTVQAETENAIGQVLQLNADGTGTEASLSKIEQRVNTALQINLLQQGNEGPRASSAVWTASRTDNLSVPGATLHGVLALNLNGTLENIDTEIDVQ